MTVNISATFTKATKPYNGLDAIAHELVDDGRLHDSHLVVARVSTKFYKASAEDGTRVPTIRIDHVEVMTEEADIKTAGALLDARYRARNGNAPQDQLPLGDGQPDEWLDDKAGQ